MIERNTLQRGSDTYKWRRQALLTTTAPFDLTGETTISAFVVSGTQPADINRRIIFKVDDKLFYFTNDGLQLYPYYGELADILEHGNTVAELLAVEGIAEWLNKKVYPIIALDAPRDATVMPRIKLGLKVNCFNDEYTRDIFSPIYELKHGDNPARITQATAEKVLNGYAQAETLIRTRDKFGVWSDFVAIDAVKNVEADAAQFKVTYTLTTLDGSDEAQVTQAKVDYVTDSKNLAGDTQEIITLPQTYYQNFGTCYALIKTSELIDCEVKAFVKFQTPPKRRENLLIGKGNGELKTYYLGLNGGYDPNINQTTLHLSAGNKNIVDYYYNTENGTVELQADSDVEIYASYDYDVDAEIWLPMTGQIAENKGGQYMSRFVYRLSDTENKRISAVKFSITRKTGKVENFELGTATGKLQIFPLAHRAFKESISAKGNWTYDEDTQLFEVVGTINDTLTISYDWAGLLPQIYFFSVGYTPAI